MQLRKAEIKDKKDILNIINVMHLDIPGFVWNKDEFVERQISNGEYFVAEVENKVAGIISLRQRKEKMYVETLAVLPEYRLQKIGAGLVGFAKDFTKEKRIGELYACSFVEYNIGSFYAKQGFSLVNRPGIYNGHKYHIFIASI